MKIGFTSYINAYPFVAAWKHGIVDFEAEVVFDVPTNLNERFKNGELDIALISSVEYLRGNYCFVSPFGIGSKGPILSVNFYIKEDYNTSEIECGVTDESATSIKLLQVIAAQFWKKKLKLTKLAPTNPSFLLIGNQALEKQHIEGFKTIDLSNEWYKFTDCGFVFALFAARKEQKTFCEKLKTSLEWSQNHFDTVLDMAMKTSHHDKAFLKKYYEHHAYTLNDHILGLNKFSSYV